MNDYVNCPYCDAEVSVEVSDFYEDNVVLEYECADCLRSFEVHGVPSIEFVVSKIEEEDV